MNLSNMYQLLTQYLFQFKKLFVPSIGTFTVETKDAINDFAKQSVQAPGWNIHFIQSGGDLSEVAETTIPGNNSELEGTYDWLTSRLNVSAEDAVLQYDEFSDALRTRLDKGETIEWEGLGKLEKNDGVINFVANESSASPFTAVTAKKVVRENASHNVLVGERETTSDEMRQRLEKSERVSRPVGKRIMWGLFFISLAMLAWYFLRNGCSVSSMGNQENVEVTKPPETYRLK